MKEIDEKIIIGRNPVMEALKSNENIDTIYISSNKGLLGKICSMAKSAGIVVKNCDDRKLDQLANGGVHQGVAAVGAFAQYVSVALIRTAETAGADGLIIPKRRSASLTSIVYKTSAGAASWLPVARVSNLASAIDTLKENGVWIYGTDAGGELYTDTDLTGSIALVIGSEGFGMGRLIKEKCDFLLKLPMFGKVTSLNASVAGGIFMYEAVRQRIKSAE